MGTSTDAYLFFGFELNDSDDNIGFSEDIVELLEREDLDNEKDDEVLEFLGQKYGFEFGRHCSSAYPVFYVSIKDLSASRGYSHRFDNLPTIEESDVKRLKELSRILLGKEIKPKWILASYWG